MTVTIKDIARKVGVSPSTVSRALNGNTRISDTTTRKIQEAMEELDYHPNSLARNFANGLTYCIGLIIDARDENTFANAFFNRSVFAIEKVIQEYGYSLMITNDRKKEGKSTVENLMLEKKVDGLIMPSSIVRPELIMELNQAGFPFIVMGEPKKYKTDATWIDVDNELGSHMAVEHLIQSGYSKIALVTEKANTVFTQKRLAGYLACLKKHNIQINQDLILQYGQDITADNKRIEELMSGNSHPDAFLCGNNIIAFNVLKTLKNINYRIPDDIGIVTFDNYPVAEYTDPPLTAVDVDTYGMGIQVAKQLLRKIQDNSKDTNHMYIPTNIIVRESSMKGDRKNNDKNGGAS
ncbi:LacI family DNA-binding transcriptional regulator [Anaerocolumna xylanovorans]|uniref:Transcriptional regulator, LacI family n=1 Tax=Anaerocolumna xylanovorans DSM 12503 TaxID=1121345 RepID=A0A1M7Y9J0_9FIRM|nr:LacI family DNA-binding transcriptional regulator [Anaerocolumna xylanovorans]SHO49287.1 transcriptional regulator, LacI family [Anaerocolumna xylanovorans DSM 12503]